MKNLWTKKNLLWAWSRGFYFTFIQLISCLLLASLTAGPGKAYSRFIQWDSFHYMDIVDHGYHIPLGEIRAEDVHSNRANVGYFPAYPLLAKGIHSLGIPTPISLLMIAHLFCLLFWTQFFLLLSLWGIPKKNAFWSGLTLSFFPASFYLVMGYSESLFMAALVGLILWTEVWHSQTQGKRFNFSWFLASLSGFLLSSTRLVGLPLMIYPLIRFTSFRSTLLSMITLLGGTAFFGWSQVHFGQWNLYFKLQQLGWDNHPNYLAVINPSSYIPRLFFEDTVTSVCRASNAFIFLLFLWLVREEFNQHSKTQQVSYWGSKRAEWSLYFIAFSMFFVCLSGKSNAHMDSMVRYNLPVFMVIILIAAKREIACHMSSVRLSSFRWGILSYLLALIVQIWMAYLFTKGGWVA